MPSPVLGILNILMQNLISLASSILCICAETGQYSYSITIQPFFSLFPKKISCFLITCFDFVKHLFAIPMHFHVTVSHFPRIIVNLLRIIGLSFGGEKGQVIQMLIDYTLLKEKKENCNFELIIISQNPKSTLEALRFFQHGGNYSPQSNRITSSNNSSPLLWSLDTLLHLADNTLSLSECRRSSLSTISCSLQH